MTALVKMALPSSILNSQVLLVPEVKLLLRPVPKVASTVLKRIAVIADGRVPPEQASPFETRPALAIHNPDLHSLTTLANATIDLAHEALYSQEWIRLAVTRNPAERLLSFWHDKLHLMEPAYAPLNSSVQLSLKQSTELSCSFRDFLIFLNSNWEPLKQDGHLIPQFESLEPDCVSYTHILDRNDLVKQLPILLQKNITSSKLQLIKIELANYNQLYRQRLGKSWMEAYSEEGLSLIRNYYILDLQHFNYQLPSRKGSIVKPLALSSIEALVDPLQQIRDRNYQISCFQAEILNLKKQLAEFLNEQTSPKLPSITEPQGTWEEHNKPESGFNELYELLNSSNFEDVILLSSDSKYDQSKGELFYLLGVANHLLGNHDASLSNFNTAIEKEFITPFIYFNMGNALRGAQRPLEGLEAYRQALKMFPGFSECRHNICLGLIETGNIEEAELELRKLLRDHPSYYQASFCLGNLLRDHKRIPEAVEAFRLCLQFAPCYADAWNNMGLALASLGKTEEAISSYRHALSIDANFRPSRQNLAQALVRDKAHSEALNEFEKLANLQLNEQDSIIALQGRINCLLELDRYEDALALANNSSEDNRLVLMARLHVLPVLYHDEEQLEAIRQRYLQDLTDLYLLLESLDQIDPSWPFLYAHAWSLTNFYLAYQMGNDRCFQELYAGILDRILRPKLNQFMQKIPYIDHKDGSPIKIGIISPHLKNHNGAIWALGWLDEIANTTSFKIFCYNIGEEEDYGTWRFANLGIYRHLHLNPFNPESQLRQIIDDKLDLLIFTDIGMHPASKITSVLQLATVQAQGWGHPITSGSLTMKYFFGSAGMDPEENKAHYSEQLIRLPGIGLNYETPIALHDGSILYEKLNLPTNRPLILSLQSTFKYVPRNDWTFAQIAYLNKNALILLVGHMGNGSIVERLINRLRPHFEDRGLVIEEHLQVLPRLDHGDFMGLFSIAHHTIDTIDWNGGNSSLQAFSLNCPVITMPTEFMRGRHTIAMLLELDLPELIAKDRDSYVSLSTKLLNDKKFYNKIKEKINSRKSILFNDKRSPKELKALIETEFLT